MDEKELKWFRPIFVVTNSEIPPSRKTKKIDKLQHHGEIQHVEGNYWIRIRDIIEGIEISALLLLNHFGPNKFVTKFVAKNLINKIIGSSEFLIVIKQLKESTLNSSKANTSIDNKVYELIKTTFEQVDNDCYEAALTPILNENHGVEAEYINSSPDLFLNSGCSAILALIIENRLYISNCGNSVGILGKEIGDGMAVFQVSETHEEYDKLENSHISASSSKSINSIENNNLEEFFGKTPFRCFGDYGRKTEFQKPSKDVIQEDVLRTSTASPFVVRNIELNHTVRFVILLTPITAKIIQKVYPQDNKANAILASLIMEALQDPNKKSDSKAIEKVLQRLLLEFCNKFNIEKIKYPTIEMALIYIDLSSCPSSFSFNQLNKDENSNSLESSLSKTCLTNDTIAPINGYKKDEENSLPADSGSTVESVVDWSEFYVSELRDTVLAKIESLKQHFKEKIELCVIAED